MPTVRRHRGTTPTIVPSTPRTNKPARNTTTNTPATHRRGGDVVVAGATGTRMPELTKLIDSAQKRVYVRLADFSDPGVVKSLEQAVARGVDVHAIVDAPPKSNQSLLLGQGIEAQGVDVLVGGGERISHFATVADDMVYAGGSALTSSSAKSNKSGADVLAKTFDGVLHDIP